MNMSMMLDLFVMSMKIAAMKWELSVSDNVSRVGDQLDSGRLR